MWFSGTSVWHLVAVFSVFDKGRERLYIASMTKCQSLWSGILFVFIDIVNECVSDIMARLRQMRDTVSICVIDKIKIL